MYIHINFFRRVLHVQNIEFKNNSMPKLDYTYPNKVQLFLSM